MRCFYRIPFGPECDKEAVLFDINGVEDLPFSQQNPKFRCIAHAIEEDKKMEELNANGKVELTMPNWKSVKEYPGEQV